MFCIWPHGLISEWNYLRKTLVPWFIYEVRQLFVEGWAKTRQIHSRVGDSTTNAWFPIHSYKSTWFGLQKKTNRVLEKSWWFFLFKFIRYKCVFRCDSFTKSLSALRLELEIPPKYWFLVRPTTSRFFELWTSFRSNLRTTCATFMNKSYEWAHLKPYDVYCLNCSTALCLSIRKNWSALDYFCNMNETTS